MPAPEPWVYILEGSPQYDNAGTMEERKVRFFSGSQVDGLLSTGAKAHIGLSQQLSATVAVDHPLIGGSAARGTTFGEITISWGGGDRDALRPASSEWLPPGVCPRTKSAAKCGADRVSAGGSWRAASP